MGKEFDPIEVLAARLFVEIESADPSLQVQSLEWERLPEHSKRIWRAAITALIDEESEFLTSALDRAPPPPK